MLPQTKNNHAHAEDIRKVISCHTNHSRSIYHIEAHDTDRTARVSFSEAIKNAAAHQIQGRHKVVGDKGRRLENYREDANYYLLNFTTSEFSGPSRTEPTSEATPFYLSSNEYFAHENAMLYDPEANMAFLESTLNGMRAGAIADYFKEFANRNESYTLIPQLDAEAAARARRYQTIRSVNLRVAMGPITGADREAGIGVIKSFGENYDAGTIDIEIKAQRERGRSLSLTSVWWTIANILGNDAPNNVTRMIVKGREHDDDQIEPIDLIQHKENRETRLQVDDQTRKVPHTERWDALIKMRQEFLG